MCTQYLLEYFQNSQYSVLTQVLFLSTRFIPVRDSETWAGTYLLCIIIIYIYEPVHEIFNNVIYVTSKASDLPGHMRSLIRAFACRLNILVKLLTEHHLEFLSLKGGCTGSSETTHCWKSHDTAHIIYALMTHAISVSHGLYTIQQFC